MNAARLPIAVDALIGLRRLDSLVRSLVMPRGIAPAWFDRSAVRRFTLRRFALIHRIAVWLLTWRCRIRR